ncbi:MAG: PD-(D/E)XK nuclease family transposase, partial [Nitrospirota bacterium]
MKFIDPRTDLAFKKIFGNEQAKEILISFLNAILKLSKGYLICEIEILNPYQAPRVRLSKDSFVDVRCKDERSIWYEAEISSKLEKWIYFIKHT